MKNTILLIIIGILLATNIVFIFRSCSDPNTTKEQADTKVEQYKKEDATKAAWISEIQSKNDSLKLRLDSVQDANVVLQSLIKQIPVKYEKVRNDIRNLPADKQLHLFSEFLSSIDSTGN